RESDREHAERPSRLEREPHQRDVLERVAELADGDGPVDVTEVAPTQEGERPVGCLGLGVLGSKTRQSGCRGLGHLVVLPHRPGLHWRAMAQRTAVRLTGDDLTLADVWDVAVHRAPAELSADARGKIDAARRLVERAAHGLDEHTYGINTGFGRFVSQ